MDFLKTSMDQNGRILIPLEIRKQYKMTPGDNFILEVESNSIKICQIDAVIDQLHDMFFKYKPKVPGKSVLEDFLNDRRKQSELEKQDFVKNEKLKEESDEKLNNNGRSDNNEELQISGSNQKLEKNNQKNNLNRNDFNENNSDKSDLNKDESGKND